uniref:Group XV phospholipase A2 n=1 Tax=Schistosoma haematobium TaxID=6185 RepID=A0A094ZKP9_SCHHA
MNNCKKCRFQELLERVTQNTVHHILLHGLFTSSSYNLKGIALEKVRDENIRYPLILIHGIGGTQALCKPTDKQSHTKPFTLWVKLLYFLIPEKLFTYMGLIYDPKTKKTRDRELCNVEFPGWGDTWASEYLSEEKYPLTSYMKSLVQSLTEDKFFVRNKTIRSAPYDFRKAPNENAKYFVKLKELVEETYENSEKCPVYLLGHSLGSLYSMYFLKLQDKRWKHKYIKGFISVSGPFGGSVESLYAETCGHNFGIPFRSPLAFRDIERSFPAMTFLLPDPRVWSASYLMMKETKSLFNPSERPTDIEVYCVYSFNIPTILQMIFNIPGPHRSAFPNQIPKLKYGDGDGVVPLKSLSVCNKWNYVNVVVLEQSSHEDIVQDDRFIKYLKKLLIND